MNKMRKCKTCGADMAKGAKVCPSCGAKNKKHTTLAIVLIILGICLIAAAFGGNGDKPKKVGASTPVPSVTPVPEQTRFTVGDQVALSDIVVTFVNCEENSGSQFNEPADGNVFVTCEFTIENNSSKDIAISSLMSFEAYVDDYATSLSLTALISTDKTQLDGSVAAGKKMNGIIGYEVPRDWKELEISFTPDFWSGKDITFVASH